MLKTNSQPMIISSFVNPIEENHSVKNKFDLLDIFNNFFIGPIILFVAALNECILV